MSKEVIKILTHYFIINIENSFNLALKCIFVIRQIRWPT